MDEILKSEVIVVVLERKEGVSFEEFAGLFHQVHGYQLKLTNYGYKSLKDLLDNMKDEVELQNINGQILIKCRQPNQPNVISPQENGPNIPGTCSASSDICWLQSGDIPLDEFSTDQTSCQQNAPVIRCYKSLPPAKQSTLLTQDHFTSDAYSTKDTCLTRKQMPSKEIVKKITKKMRSHPTGLRAEKLRQYILEQHKIDLELSSRELGYTDMLSMLKQIPTIRFLNTSGKNVIIPSYMYKNLPENQEIPSAKAELLKVDPSSTSKSALSAKHSAQLDDFSHRKKAKKEHLCSIGRQSQENEPIISEAWAASSHEPGSKTDHLFSRINNHAQPVSSHKDPTPTLLIDSNSAKQKRINTTKKSFQFISEKVTDGLRLFPSGLKVEKLTQHMKNDYKIDLMKLGQENGCTDMIEMLEKIPGIKVVNKNVIVASDVYKMSNSKSNATCKTMPGKFPTNARTRVTKNLYVQRETTRGNQTVAKPRITRPSGTGQQPSLLVTSNRIPLTTAMINRPQNVQPGLRPNVSYASACASNLRKDQINVHTLQHPPSFNVQKAHTASASQPKCKEIPKGVLPSSEIKFSLQLVLKSNANGLSIFQLKKLYLLKFQQPLVPKGSSIRKFLMDMKDVAKIKGVGVQMKVFPVLSEDDLSASANIYRDSTSQGIAALVAKDGEDNEVLTLSIKNSTEHIKHSVPMPLSKHLPSFSGFSHTELTGGHVPTSSSANISQKQPFHHSHDQPITEIYDKTFYRTDLSHSANNHLTLSSQFSEINESPLPASNVRNLSDAQWPSLPKKLSILKEIKQRPKVSEQLHEIIPSNELHFIQNSPATSQPQVKESSVQTLQAHQDAYKANGNIDSKQEPQTSDLVHPVLPSGFSIVMEDTGFSFVRGEKNVDQETKSMEVALAGDPPITFTNSAHVGFELSGVDGRGNTHATPLQPNQSALCKMAAQNTGSAPDAIRKSVNVSAQKMADLSSKELSQQTNNHLAISETMGSIFSKPNLKTQSAKCDFPETGFTVLQAEGMQPSCTSEQTVSMPSKEQQEASNSKRESTSSPLKQEVSKSNLSNRCGLAVSPRSHSPKKASKSKTIVGTQNVSKEKSLSGAQTTGNVKPVSSPVLQIQQKVEHTLHKDMNIVNGQIGLKTQNKEHSQTRNGVKETTASLSSAQEKANTGQIHTHEQRVTDPEQTKPKVPHPHTSPSMEKSRFSLGTHNYYNGTDNRAPEEEESLTSQSHQHISHSSRSVDPSLSEFSIPPYDQQDSLDNSSEESTRTWQTDGGQSCCIL